MCEKGLGIPPNQEQAVRLYTSAASSGNAGAVKELGRCYQLGLAVEKDEIKAVCMYRKGAELGHAPSLWCLAQCYASGIGVAADRQKVLDCHRRAAALGYAPSLYAHGCLLLDTDKAAAVDCFQRAAAAMHVESIYALGQCAEQATERHERETVETARKFYLQAASHGHLPSQLRVAQLDQVRTAMADAEMVRN
jgi:hypothetical protein